MSYDNNFQSRMLLPNVRIICVLERGLHKVWQTSTGRTYLWVSKSICLPFRVSIWSVKSWFNHVAGVSRTTNGGDYVWLVGAIGCITVILVLVDEVYLRLRFDLREALAFRLRVLRARLPTTTLFSLYTTLQTTHTQKEEGRRRRRRRKTLNKVSQFYLILRGTLYHYQ